MKVVQGDEIPLVRGLEYRGGMFHSRRLLEGTPGTVDNFQLSIGVSQGDFYSPRHRHNFEQIRVQLDGEAGFDRDGNMTPGTVGYFPEGVFYGPQSAGRTEKAHETVQLGMFFHQRPVEPAKFVVVAIGVVIAILGAPHFVAHQDHGHAE